MRWEGTKNVCAESLNTPVVELNSPFKDESKNVDTNLFVSRCDPEDFKPKEFTFTKEMRKRRRSAATYNDELNGLDLTAQFENHIEFCLKTSAASDNNNNSSKRIGSREEMMSLQCQRAIIADSDGDRPIHIAAAQGDVSLVKKLCSLMQRISASIDVVNHIKQTPLHIAVITGNAEIVEFLLSRGASLHLHDRNGCTAVLLAIKYYQKATMDTLFKYPATRNVLNCMDYDGLTCLHHAVLRNNYDAVNQLYHAGADMNTFEGKSGRTALAQAVVMGNAEMVKLLLQCNACIERSDYSGQSCLDLALMTGKKKICRILERHDIIREQRKS